MLTAELYNRAVQLFLKKFTEHYGREFPRNLCPDGKLRLSQFYSFNHPQHIPVFETPERILELIGSASMRKLCFAAYTKLVNGLYQFMFEESVLDQFFDPAEGSQALKIARRERQLERQHVDQVQSKLKTNKLYVGFDAEIEANQRLKRQFLQEFAGNRTPVATVDIPAYLESAPVKNLFEAIADIVCDKNRIPSKTEWNSLIHGFAKILHIRQGHRQEWIPKFTMEKYFDLPNPFFSE